MDCCNVLSTSNLTLSRLDYRRMIKSCRVFSGNPPNTASLDLGLKTGQRASHAVLFARGPEERIREALSNVELSVSSYDTAWVAMVPSPSSLHFPCFPECVEWILENQHPDGSWSLPNRHPSLMKDALSSTLACVLALERWNMGVEHVKRGFHFVGSNISFATDENQISPVGFDIIFPGMIKYAKNMGLNLPMSQTEIDAMLCMQDLELKSGSGSNSKGRKAYLAYVAEGLGKLEDLQEVMKYQRKNGSLFNSPSATAAAVTHLRDAKGLEYLRLLLQKFGGSVPTTYPIDISILLSMADSLERLGIARHFRDEIKTILDETYRCWLQDDEEIHLDIATLAMAFRLLRVNGYDVSSDALAKVAEENLFYNSVDGHLKDMNTVLELYKASQIKISLNEHVLEKLSLWSSHFLKQKLSNNAGHGFHQEVDYALKFPFHANLERLEHKQNIEHYDLENIRILKTSYTIHNINKKDFLEFAVEDFNICQSIYLKELKDLERWVKENKLDQLKFSRQKLTYCYFSAAATLFSPEISDARMSWAKNGILATVVDDFFDIGGSREELTNLITLAEKWDGNYEKDCCSDQVKIVFSALYNTINELGEKASALQKRSITSHLIEIWLCLMKTMMREAEWLNDNYVPTIDEYMENAYTSFALGPIILPALYFVGPKLSEDVIRDPEYHNLFKLVSTCGRLLNDTQGFEREGKEGKLNSISLRMLHSSGAIPVEEAKREMESVIESSRRELLRLVLQSEGSVVPRACKDLFWKMSRIVHLFYMRTDGFTSPHEMVSAVNAVIHDPLKLQNLKSANA